MKTVLMIPTVVAGIALQTGLLGGTMFQELSNDRAEMNRAVAASPRAKEEFPWLVRSYRPAPEGKVQYTSGTATTSTSSRHFGSVPRILEEFPQLARADFREKTPANDLAIQGTTGRGLAANPRALEENPALARRGRISDQTPQFEIAPLK